MLVVVPVGVGLMDPAQESGVEEEIVLKMMTAKDGTLAEVV